MPETAPYGNAGCAVHGRHGSRRPRSGTGGTPARPAAAQRRVHGRGSAGLPPIRRRSVDDPSSIGQRSVVGLSGRAAAASAPPCGPGRRCRARTRPAPSVRNPPRGRRVRTPPVGIRTPRGDRPPPSGPAKGGAWRRPPLRGVRRLNGCFPHTRPYVFSQLHSPANPLPKWPINPLASRQKETARYASTQRGRAMNGRRTSLHDSRVKRFVIECFPPGCLVDIKPVGELVTTAPRDAVDSILGVEGWGLVHDRGDKCRCDRPVRTRKTRTPRGA